MEREEFDKLIRNSSPSDWKEIGKGRQSTVYSRDGLDFVIKLPNKGFEDQLKEGHAIARDRLGGLSTPFDSIIINPSLIRPEGNGKPVPAYVHEKVLPLESAVAMYMKDNPGQAVKLVENLALLDQTICGRGAYTILLEQKNYGVNGRRDVVHLDSGDFRQYPGIRGGRPESIERSHFYRGLSHYRRVEWLMRTGIPIANAYMQSSGLDFKGILQKDLTVRMVEFFRWKRAIAEELMEKGFLKKMSANEVNFNEIWYVYQQSPKHNSQLFYAVNAVIFRQKGVYSAFVDIAKQEMDKYFKPDGLGNPLGHYFGQNTIQK